ncbi:hypothetical protein RSM1_14890 [Methylobacterium radiotolerans]|nr:hypothetical protein RSM1_14890 [Methylobacterium radiotolerans]
MQPRQRQRQQVAALRGDQRVQLVEHHAAQTGKKLSRLAVGDQQGQLLGRGQKDVRRPADLAGALVGRRVTGAGLDAHRQRHLGDRRVEVAGNVHRQRLQGRDVEGVEARRLLLRPALGEVDETRQEAGQRLAGPGRRHQQRRAAGAGDPQEIELVRPGRPAAAREPGAESFRQDLGRDAQASAIRKRSISSSARSLIGLG